MRSFVSLSLAIAVTTVAAPTIACPAVVPTCGSLDNPIYLQVGDTQLNLMKALGRKLRDNTAKPITLVFFTNGSCTNIDATYHHLPATGTAPQVNMQWIQSASEDPNWTQSSATCQCAPTSPQMLDIGNSALFNSACTTEAPPADVNLTTGPRQGYVLAMPRGTSETAMTYEEAYFVFGFGPTMLASMSAAIAPWTDEAQLYIRTTTKSTLLAWAANISVPAASWHGNKLDTSGAVVAGLQTSTNPSAAVGLLGVEVYDGLRATLTTLAFRAYHQYAAYYPDSTATSRDKKNVRDGRYTVWSPTIWMDYASGGQPVKPDARYVVDLIAGHVVTPAPNFDASVAVAKVGLVPDCAMRVTRSFEGGPLSLYKPTTSCTCAYENAVDVSTCTTCTTTCTTGVCRDGYCEEF